WHQVHLQRRQYLHRVCDATAPVYLLGNRHGADTRYPVAPRLGPDAHLSLQFDLLSQVLSPLSARREGVQAPEFHALHQAGCDGIDGAGIWLEALPAE